VPVQRSRQATSEKTLNVCPRPLPLVQNVLSCAENCCPFEAVAVRPPAKLGHAGSDVVVVVDVSVTVSVSVAMLVIVVVGVGVMTLQGLVTVDVTLTVAPATVVVLCE
jgi:hypothetical protein